MKNEAGLRPMKRAFGTRRVFRALRFTATKLLLHTSRKACASYSRSECFIASFPIPPNPRTDSNRHTLSEAIQKSFTFQIYLQSHRCKGILDRFKPPHRFKSNAKRKYKIALSCKWTDPNYRKPNTDLLKTKKSHGS